MLRRLLGLLCLAVLLLVPGSSAAQLRIPGFDSDAVLLPQDPADGLKASLGADQEAFGGRLERRQTEFRWRLERIDRMRSELATDEQRWRERRDVLVAKRAGPARREVLTLLLELARELDGLLRSTEAALDQQVQTLTDAEARARQLQVRVSGSQGWGDDELTTAEVDRALDDLAIELARRESRLLDLESSRELLEAAFQEHREALAAARLAMVVEGAVEVLEQAAPVPPEPSPGPEAPLAPGLEPSTPAPPPASPPMVLLSEAERELIGLRDDMRRIEASILERSADLDRKNLELVELDIERERLELPVERYFVERWAERREEVAAREGEGVFRRSEALLDGGALTTGIDYTSGLLADPGTTLQEVQQRIQAARRPARRTSGLLMVVLGVLGLFSFGVGRRALPALTKGSESRGDVLVLVALGAVVPVFPVTMVCGVLLLSGAIPEPLRPLYRFSALAPPLVGMVIGVTSTLFPQGGSETMRPSVARYLRGLVRIGASLATVIGLGAAMLPLFGYPAEVRRLLQAALVAWLLIGWLGILLRRDELLTLIGADGDVASVGVLRVGIRRLYRAFAIGPVAVWILYAIGYANLARLLVRGGLVTLGVLLLAPWVYHRLEKGAEQVLGYPDGGGWLALSAEGSRTAWRSVMPLLLLLVGGGSVGLVASGWDYDGNVFGNLASLVTSPLLAVGGSNITGVSLLLFACTVVVTILASRWVLQVLRRSVYPLYDLDKGMRATLDTVIRYALFGVGTVIGLDVIGVGLGFLTIFAGVVGLAVGFGSQTLAANFMAGLILLAARRISVDDVIELDSVVGRVVRIGGYATTIRTLDNLLVIIPNGKLIDGTVTNWSVEDIKIRMPVIVGVAYGSDVALVRRLLLEAARADPRVMSHPAPMARFDDFGDSALVFSLNVWIDDADERLVVASDLRVRIDQAFRDNGVEIPFPQRDLHLRTGDATLSVALERGYDVKDLEGNLLAGGD